MQALARLDAGVGVGQHIQHTTPRTHLLQIAFEFFQQGIVGCDGDHRHGAGHQRKRAVFELSRWVGLGVDIANFFKLQRTFQGNRVVQATP